MFKKLESFIESLIRLKGTELKIVRPMTTKKLVPCLVNGSVRYRWIRVAI